MLAPSPAWEQGLEALLTAEQGQAKIRSSGPGQNNGVHRVPAGLALGSERPDSGFAAAARRVWPDPERLSIVVGQAVQGDGLRENLERLLTLLAPGHPAGIRLHWPGAGAGARASVIQDLAKGTGVDLFAPAADVSASGFGGVRHGPAGAVPWLQFGRDGTISALGAGARRGEYHGAARAGDLRAHRGRTVRLPAGVTPGRADHDRAEPAAGSGADDDRHRRGRGRRAEPPGYRGGTIRSRAARSGALRAVRPGRCPAAGP